MPTIKQVILSFRVFSGIEIQCYSVELCLLKCNKFMPDSFIKGLFWLLSKECPTQDILA